MRTILTIILTLSSYIVAAETINGLIEKLASKDIKAEYFPYDVSELILNKLDPDVWPDYSALSKPEQYVMVVGDFEGQINNGGFDQYYFNSYGDNAVVAVEALRAIGANESAELLIKSFGVFPANTPSPIRDIRWAQLETLTVKQNEFLSSLDDQFYEYPNDLAALLTKYIKSNLGAFQ